MEKKDYKIVYEQGYCQYFDITIIKKEIYYGDKIIKEKISGYYYGSPEEQALDTFKEKNYIIFNDPEVI